MKSSAPLCLGLLLMVTGLNQASAQTTKIPQLSSDAGIAAIRQEIQTIEKNAPKFRRLAIPWEGRSAEGGELIGFFQGSSLRKVAEDVFGEMGRATTEFYFQSNLLIFAVSTTIHYNRPFYFDEKTKDLEITSRVQERCWFAQGRLIAAVGNDGKTIPVMSAKAQKLAEDFAETAKEATAALSKAKGRELFGEETKHPLDCKVDALLSKAKCIADETFAACMAAQLWDEELNRVYGELRRKLDATDAKQLQDAQRKWIVWRDAEFKMTDSLYGHQPGTMFQPMCEQHKLGVVRGRALELQHWLELQENHLDHRREMDALEKGSR